jgi:RimJ/RimL family protein N-acetyltransferase
MTDDVVRFFGVPELVELDGGVVLRRYTAADIEPLVDVVNDSLDHLRPWMPWAQEPVTVESQGAWFRESEVHWAEGINFVYGIFSPSGGILGGTGFHIRNGPGVLEIGYWLSRRATGRGLATQASAALTGVAGTIAGAERVEIHCDVGNTRSSAVPRRLGYTLLRTEEREVAAPGESGRHEIWSIDVAGPMVASDRPAG